MKGHTYLNKPEAESCQFVEVFKTFKWTLGTKGQILPLQQGET